MPLLLAFLALLVPLLPLTAVLALRVKTAPAQVPQLLPPLAAG